MARVNQHPIMALLARGLHTTALRFSSTAFGLVFGIIAARVAGSTEFGEYVSIITVVGLTITLVSLGMPQVLAREIASIGGEQNSNPIKVTLQLSLVMLAIFLIVAFVTLLQSSRSLTFGLFFLLMSLSLSIFVAVLNGSEKVIWGMWLNGVIRPGLALAILAGSILIWTPDATGLFAIQLAAVSLTAGIATLFLRARGVFRLKWPFERKLISGPAAHRTLKTGVLLASTQALIGLTTQLDVLILTAFGSLDEVAHYYAAARAALVVSFFAGSAALVMEPTITRLLAEKNYSKAQSVIHQIALSGVIISVVVLCFAIPLAPYYLRLYGADFLSASSALYLLSGSFVVFSLFGPAESTLRAGRLDSTTLAILAISTFVNAIVSTLLVFPLGVLGVAIGSATQFVLAGSLMMFKARQILNQKTDIFEALASIVKKKVNLKKNRDNKGIK